MNGKCPKCDKFILHVNAIGVPIHVSGRMKWKGVAYTCPACDSILNVEIDPVVLQETALRELLEGVKKP